MLIVSMIYLRPIVQVLLLWPVAWFLGWHLHIRLARQLLWVPCNIDHVVSDVLAQKISDATRQGNICLYKYWL